MLDGNRKHEIKQRNEKFSLVSKVYWSFVSYPMLPGTFSANMYLHQIPTLIYKSPNNLYLLINKLVFYITYYITLIK